MTKGTQVSFFFVTFGTCPHFAIHSMRERLQAQHPLSVVCDKSSPENSKDPGDDTSALATEGCRIADDGRTGTGLLGCSLPCRVYGPYLHLTRDENVTRTKRHEQ